MSNLLSQAAIAALIDQQTNAIRIKDIAGATANYKADVVLFDVVGPLRHQGSASVKKRLKEWFATFNDDKPIHFETIDLKISADNDTAFSHNFNHINAPLKDGGTLDMYWRETLNWEKTAKKWQIVSAHSSVPFDPNTGLASTGFKPGVGSSPVEKKADLIQLVKSCMEAYQTKNRPLVENILHTDFTFTSPQDDHINKAAYFARCWPFSDFDPVYHFVNFTQSSDSVFVLYECETNEKKVFRNMEHIRFKGDKIISVEVYFGRSYS